MPAVPFRPGDHHANSLRFKGQLTSGPGIAIYNFNLALSTTRGRARWPQHKPGRQQRR